MKVAAVSVVADERTKSSADSISSFPVLAGRDALPSFPSESPVLKKNGFASAGWKTAAAIHVTVAASSSPLEPCRPPLF